ncbi:oligosaccharide flippase family protein [Pseudoalteromonas phenolica]|uniref:oligosaccharide flippase family protein n=1 Tax=Pseudoalteromonas phenolica TaxID=161398 RepID=UPI000FFEE482|nr:oligosaccharide flippase family protein [Pseudoalteromonas phenolica]RXF05546.1 hypothetical protein D9981_02630 [Pseudoalteromonas phenolica O-BC30]
MKKNERKLGVVLTYANIFLNTAVVLLFTPILINYLGNSGFGLYSLALTILTYIALLDFGFGNSIIVFTSKYRASKESERQKSLYASILVAYIALSVFASFALYVFYINIESNFSSGMSENEIELFKIIFIIISFNIIFSIPLNLYKSILTAYERFGFIKLASLTRTLLTPLLLCISIAFNIDVVGIVLIISVVNFLVLFFAFFYIITPISNFLSVFLTLN